MAAYAFTKTAMALHYVVAGVASITIDGDSMAAQMIRRSNVNRFSLPINTAGGDFIF